MKDVDWTDRKMCSVLAVNVPKQKDQAKRIVDPVSDHILVMWELYIFFLFSFFIVVQVQLSPFPSPTPDLPTLLSMWPLQLFLKTLPPTPPLSPPTSPLVTVSLFLISMCLFIQFRVECVGDNPSIFLCSNEPNDHMCNPY